jgi:hypothetical protein
MSDNIISDNINNNIISDNNERKKTINKSEIYNNNNKIDKNTEIDKIRDIINKCEHKTTYNISKEIFNISINNKIELNCGIINMRCFNINYLINILNYITKVNTNHNKYILFLSIHSFRDIKCNYDELTDENNIKYYTIDDIIIYNIKNIKKVIPLLDNKHNNIKYIIQYSNSVNLNISNIKSNNYIWYILSNNRNINTFKNIFDTSNFENFIQQQYININIDKKYNPTFTIINDIYLFRQLEKIYTSEFTNFNTDLLKSKYNYILQRHKQSTLHHNYDILRYFIKKLNKIYPNYYIDIKQFKLNNPCCILYDYPEKVSITKCCNNILDYQSCIKYFYQSNKCCICRKEYNNNDIDKHIYVYKHI